MPTIQEECARRGITRLFHFTPIEHLPDILRHGLMTPEMGDLFGVTCKPNDEHRFDGQDALCLSIEWPNYKLLWNFRQRDTNRKWAIIQLPVDILWLKRCCFNTTNAADNSMSTQTFQARQGIVPFLKMFEDYGEKTRVALRIDDNYPTNPQAEVLCLDTIETNYLQAVYFDDLATARGVKNAFPRFVMYAQGTYHSYRHDWAHWKN